ncbi:MAG TPA: glycoside hydrolase family 95 protein, partial [Clostridia bacterium]|nr:glycoside hydrolase family 95 protein [Clostridia bacterium]
MDSRTMKLWYEQPAREWVEALPLGNGRIGAMVFSIPYEDVFMLNEDTLWSGYPRDTNVADAAEYHPKALELIMQKKYNEAQEYIEDHMLGAFTQSYMPLGELRLKFPNIDREKVTQYRRELSIGDAMTTTQFISNGIQFVRESFISEPDQCMIIRLSADKAKSISFTVSFDSQLKHKVSTQGHIIFLDGICPSHVEPDYVKSDNPVIYENEDDKKGIQFRTAAIIENHGGAIFSDQDSIRVENADSVVIKLCIRTSFNGFNKQPFLEGKDYIQDCRKNLIKVLDESYGDLKNRHIEDYQALYNGVQFNLGEDKNYSLPTDKRLELFKETQDDKGLYALIFQYGRYL